MKKIILLSLCILPLALFAQEGTYTIQGKIGKLNDPAKVFLTYVSGNKATTDTAVIKNGSFSFSGKVSDPKQARLMVSHDGNPVVSNPDIALIYLEKGTINIQTADSIKNAKIKGSATNEENQKLSEALKSYQQTKAALMKEYETASPEDKKEESAFMKDFEKRYEANQKQSEDIYKSFVASNPNSFVSLDIIPRVVGYAPEASDIEALFNPLSDKIKNSEGGKEVAARINRLKAIMVGATAPEFTQNDPNGNPVKLSDFRGKYLLIDFWASWCGPCRRENPSVVKTYNQFKDKNFQILGVSLDQANGKDAWLKAIEKDGLTWPQVADLQGWKNAVAQLYAVQSIPQNFLLDPNGKIIAKNLMGEALKNKLEELLK